MNYTKMKMALAQISDAVKLMTEALDEVECCPPVQDPTNDGSEFSMEYVQARVLAVISKAREYGWVKQADAIRELLRSLDNSTPSQFARMEILHACNDYMQSITTDTGMPVDQAVGALKDSLKNAV